jgi:hypothetical protein
MNRQDARITALEEAVKGLLEHMVGPKSQQAEAEPRPEDYPKATEEAIDAGMTDG